MGHWRIISLALAVSMAIILHSSNAHNEPEDFLHAHSCVRRLQEVPPLVWDPDLAKTAQAWADKRKDCQLVASDKPGENMVQGPNINASYGVMLWVEERLNYDYEKNECKPGKECKHYTQVAWNTTERLGCGISKCDPADQNKFIIVCNYDPPGNIVGVRPYYIPPYEG